MVKLYGKNYYSFSSVKRNVIHGSFLVKDDKETYIWIRRFKSEEHKNKLYEDVYKSSRWINEISPVVAKLIDIDAIVVRDLQSTDLSIMK